MGISVLVRTARAAIAALILLIPCTVFSAEKVTVKLLNGIPASCDIVKVSKAGVVVKTAGGIEQTIPLERMEPKDVVQCYRQAVHLSDPLSRYELGSWFFNKHQYAEAEEELHAAIKLDDGLKAKAESILAALKALKEIEGEKKAKAGEDTESANSNEDYQRKFRKKDKEVPARTAAEMKTFLDTRQEELKSIGGTWRLIETKHFYCFSNVPEAKHKGISQWNEFLYDRLCTVLKHKEGDKLWNNKMPIYYFERYGQFQRFADKIDESPGAAYSGGYFAADGRDVHICIPFMTERFQNEAKADRIARNTLHHECTHAFLQLSGEDVPLTRWLHEGMAQFIEFWYDRENNEDGRENNPERKDRVVYLQQLISRHYVPTWEKMKMRPSSGMDMEGYAFSWTKLEFLYRNFDSQKLPQMVRMIKAGKTEDEAMQQAFGFPVPKLEEGYRLWVKANAKTGFKFQ